MFPNFYIDDDQGKLGEATGEVGTRWWVVVECRRITIFSPMASSVEKDEIWRVENSEDEEWWFYP